MSPSKDLPYSGGPNPKIAIKGFSLSSKPTSASTASTPKSPHSTLGKRPRTQFGHNDSDSDSADEKRGKHELVTGFGLEGAIKKTGQKKAEPLVIPKLKNRDWRAEAQAKRGKGKNLLPPEVQAQREAAAKDKVGGKTAYVDVVNGNDGEIQWGLSVRKRPEPSDQPANDAQESTEAQEEEPPSVKGADEEALEALLGNKKKNGPELVIEAVEDRTPPISEEDVYRRAFASAPDASTLEDYERIPVEEFGAAMLRGMGWKGEANASDKARSNTKGGKKRPNLLGLGAKELKDAEELGAWVQKADVKGLKSGGGGDGRRERKPNVADYKRERDERRYKEGGFREERERERERQREQDKERERRDRDSGGYRERDRRSDRNYRDGDRDLNGHREKDRHTGRDHRDRRR